MPLILLKSFLSLSEHVHLLERISPVYSADLKNPEIVPKLQQPGNILDFFGSFSAIQTLDLQAERASLYLRATTFRVNLSVLPSLKVQGPLRST